ncbi:MAG: ABC transporter ATP-binding protein [Epsilonproteobacteria bacterium]|nr:ABC transporter ATP-binding protein [Campylobacterota bacterium]
MESNIVRPDPRLKPTSAKSIMHASSLSHAFDYPLFENVDINIHERESIAVLGVSGSGKSTLLHILATLLKPQHGEVIYDKGFMYEQGDKRLLDIRRNDIGIIFQSHYLFKGFTVQENLEISSLISGQTLDMGLIKKLKIEDTLQQNVSDLSGGQQQRVSIARVMLKKPKLIFADEPTGNLDRQTANDVMDVMLEYVTKHHAGLFIVTHDEKIASRCNSAYRLQDKRLTAVIA